MDLEFLDYLTDIDFLFYDLLPMVLVLLAAIGIDRLAKKIAKPVVQKFITKTKTKLDDIFLEQLVNKHLIHIFPFLVLFAFSWVFQDGEELVLRVCQAVVATLLLLTFGSLLDVINDLYETSEKTSNKIPIKSHLEILKILVYVVGFVSILAMLTGTSPWFFITGVGVFTAIILMIFKDTILSFVASIQISSSDLFREGDWIEVPSYGADGDVVDISLHSVKVQNWDKTVTVIPTYKFLEASFKNWRGMTDSGGRRIKRSLNIDMNSLRFVDEEMLHRLRKISDLKDYIDEKRKEIDEYNREHGFQDDVVSGRQMTNIGTFRAYVEAYLRRSEKLHPKLTFLIRQLEPGTHGLPIQVYVFTNDVAWVNYEHIQADIFDHLLAVVPEFGLRVFQNPTGEDFKAMAQVSSTGPMT